MLKRKSGTRPPHGNGRARSVRRSTTGGHRREAGGCVRRPRQGRSRPSPRQAPAAKKAAAANDQAHPHRRRLRTRSGPRRGQRRCGQRQCRRDRLPQARGNDRHAAEKIEEARPSEGSAGFTPTEERTAQTTCSPSVDEHRQDRRFAERPRRGRHGRSCFRLASTTADQSPPQSSGRGLNHHHRSAAWRRSRRAMSLRHETLCRRLLTTRRGPRAPREEGSDEPVR